MPQPSRLRSITIFAVLVVASISGAAFAQLTAPEPMPESIGQPDTQLDITPADPLAFGDE